MPYRLGFVSALVALVSAGGVGLMAFAQNPAPDSTTPAASMHQLYALSSSTQLQTFLWLFDGGTRTVTLCYSAATPETGPQYDFKCRERSLSEATMP
jgi:hypothetical protein